MLIPPVHHVIPTSYISVTLIMIDQLHSGACLVKALSVQGALIRALVLHHHVSHPQILWLHNRSHVSDMGLGEHSQSLLGPHDTLPCVLISYFAISVYYSIETMLPIRDGTETMHVHAFMEDLTTTKSV